MNDGEAVVDRERSQRDAATARHGLWPKVRRTLGRVPFLEDVVAAYFCATDSRVPLYARAVLMGAVAYFVVPTDLIPDFIAGIGFGDDAAVLAAAVGTLRRHISEDHRDRARALLKDAAAGRDGARPAG